MTIEIIRDAMITVKAGQTVEVSPEQAALAINLGFAKEVKEKVAPKRASAKKK